MVEIRPIARCVSCTNHIAARPHHKAIDCAIQPWQHTPESFWSISRSLDKLIEIVLEISNDQLFHVHHVGIGTRFFHQFVDIFGHNLPT